MRCEYCRCTKKGRHKIWCRSKEASKIRKELNLEELKYDEEEK